LLRAPRWCFSFIGRSDHHVGEQTGRGREEFFFGGRFWPCRLLWQTTTTKTTTLLFVARNSRDTTGSRCRLQQSTNRVDSRCCGGIGSRSTNAPSRSLLSSSTRTPPSSSVFFFFDFFVEERRRRRRPTTTTRTAARTPKTTTTTTAQQEERRNTKDRLRR